MGWVVFSYSLPKAGSTARVTVWRRLRSIGAVAPKAGVYVLPAREDCVEAFQWLAQEVEQSKGEALMMRVEHLDGLPDAELIRAFQQARRRDYEEIDAAADQLEKSLRSRRNTGPRDSADARDALEKLRRWRTNIARIDFFNCPEGARVAAKLARIAETVSPRPTSEAIVAEVAVASYRDQSWVTRPHPHVDRLACAWLIRRFINPHAVIRYAHTPEPGEIAFDIAKAAFGHRGNLCTFETMVKAFRLDDPGVRAIAEIVHEIDLRDGRYARPETAGVDAVLQGWTTFPDAEREAHGVALFEGLYAALSQAGPRLPRKKPR
jgi:hypothetical protein